jgi:hypothetical protein
MNEMIQVETGTFEEIREGKPYAMLINQKTKKGDSLVFGEHDKDWIETGRKIRTVVLKSCSLIPEKEWGVVVKLVDEIWSEEE